MNEIEDIKNRLDLVEIAKEYMTVRPAGRNLKALCPLHSEKTPSLMISVDKQIWRCFGCGEGGDMFTLIEKMEGVDFYEALKILAEKAGVELRRDEGYKKYKKQQGLAIDINTLAAMFYHKSFLVSKSGQLAREYIRKRGLDDKIIEKFLIGYAPDMWDALTNFLLKRGYTNDQIVKAGLGSYTKRGNVVDRFRQRVMFPIANNRGKIVGFTGRVLREEDNPKYLNTPATKIFDKSRIWYGFGFAKDSIRQQKEVIVCEGQMDVIACHQFGFLNSVCSSGTAISTSQLKLLKRICDRVLLAFDNDGAGIRSGYRLTGMALEAGLSVKVVDLGDFKDPDEMIRSDFDKWQQSVDQAKGFVDYFLQAMDSKSSEVKDKSKLAGEIIPLIGQVPDEVEKGYYLSLLAEKLRVDEQFVIEKFNKRQKESRKIFLREEESGKISAEERLTALLMAFFGQLRHKIMSLQVDFFSGSIKEIIQMLQKKAIEKVGFKWEWITEGIDKDALDRWNSMVMKVENDYEHYDLEAVAVEIEMLMDRIESDRNESGKQILEDQIKQAETQGDREKVKDYIRRLQDLIIKGK